jgi:nitrous oxidase accessory protein NosD
MTVRIISRLVLLLVALAAATVLVVGGLSRLAAAAPADAVSLTQRNQAAAVERAIEAPAEPADSSPSPLVVLVFAGIVLMAALPPVNRVYVYHRPYHRYDWP